MNENEYSMNNLDQKPTSSVIFVPEHLREQVLEYVAQLEAEESDVSGYMIGGLTSHSLSSPLMQSFSGTGCIPVGTSGSKDVSCSDTDK